jgi:error-prone DNA polymerase
VGHRHHPGWHPVQFVRAHLGGLGIVSAARVLDVADRSRIRVGGAVTHKQRPATADGIAFLNLEDETGMINVIVHPSTFHRFRQTLQGPAIVVRGIAEVTQGTALVVADQIARLNLRVLACKSRDFR